MLVAKVMTEMICSKDPTRGEYIKITAKDRTTVGEYVLVYTGHLRIQLARVKVVAAICLSTPRFCVSTLNNTW